MTTTNSRTIKWALLVAVLLPMFIFAGSADAAVCTNRANRAQGPFYFSGAPSGGVSAGGVFGEIAGIFNR